MVGPRRDDVAIVEEGKKRRADRFRQIARDSLSAAIVSGRLHFRRRNGQDLEILSPFFVLFPFFRLHFGPFPSRKISQPSNTIIGLCTIVIIYIRNQKLSDLIYMKLL